MTYSEKLQDPRWQKTRLKVLERDNFTCICCGETTKQLHVHHCYYVSRRNPWEYHHSSLMTLCFECHKSLDEPTSLQNTLCTAFENAVIAEMSRQLSNLKNGCDPDDGVLFEFCGAAHCAGWPISEALNILRDASSFGLIDHNWLADLSKQVVAARKQRGLNK